MHGGGMDLMFPHHENELAQSEAATGQPFVHFWMHNGLTRIRTKLNSGEWTDEKMSGSLGNVISARQLVEQFGPELVRYFLLSTHYRRPIEFTDQVLSDSKKGLAVFHRLFERVQRLTDQPLAEKGPDMDSLAPGLIDGEHGDFPRAVLAFKMKFLEMMDDDFNTAGAIAVMHELAGLINSFIEQQHVEREKTPALLGLATAGAMTLKNLGGILGLFQQVSATGSRQDAGLADQLMKLLIQLRQDARKQKNFALADAIRKGLTEIGVTLEDRADGTVWRKE